MRNDAIKQKEPARRRRVAGEREGHRRACPLGTLGLALLLVTLAWTAHAQERHALPEPLPDPLRLEDVLAHARRHRQEIVAARARARAAEQRPAIVGALEDPMVLPSVDHLPFMLHGMDASLTVEQRFPLSGVRGYRRRTARAEARRLGADADRVAQDVLLDAAQAFFMLWERRELARVLDQQVELARQLVSAASARYGAGPGNQSDVLRAELEVARLEGATRAIQSEIAAAEAMLNASLGRPPDAPVPALHASPSLAEPPAWRAVQASALRRRPELEAGRAEVQRAEAEISVMKSMYAPMAMVQTGPAYTMADGWGWMAMVGVSVPLWRSRLDAGVAEARAMTAMARADWRAMARMVEGEAAAARHRVLAARQRVLALRDDVLPRARLAIDPLLGAYAVGTVPLASVIDAAQALWSLEAELVMAEVELGLAWARFQRALGALQGGDRR
jgi:cobalt-zinc-cadmium efflux system outer membrane protein